MTEPRRAVAIGSCLSNLTIAHLINDFGFQQALCVHHMRSDMFVQTVVDRGWQMIPAAFLDGYLQVKPEYDGPAQDFLRNQYPETMGFFTLNRPEGADFVRCMEEQSYDAVLIDNFMDVAAKLMSCVTRPEFAGRPLFLNPHFYANEAEICADFAFGEFLEPAQSAANILRIAQWVRVRQPRRGSSCCASTPAAAGIIPTVSAAPTASIAPSRRWRETPASPSCPPSTCRKRCRSSTIGRI